MNIASLTALRRTTSIKMGSSDDVSCTVDDGHAILRLELVNRSFSECAISQEKKRLTVGMCRRVSRIRLRKQCMCENIHVRSEVQRRRPPCCRFMARLSVNDPTQSTKRCLRSLRSRVSSSRVLVVFLHVPLLGTLLHGRRPDQPSSSALARRVCVQSSISSSILASSTPSQTP